MILVDTSIWIDYLRQGDHALAHLLNDNRVSTHPFVIGELALGRLRDRVQLLTTLQELPRTTVAVHHEVLAFVERHLLFGVGIGYADANLLASAKLTADTTIWTRDKRLHAAAKSLSLNSNPID